MISSQRQDRLSGASRNNSRLFHIKACAVLLLAGSPNVLLGQATMASLAQELDRAGFGFYDVSVFGGYTNSTTPSLGPTGAIIPDYSFHSTMAGVSASLGWRARKSDTMHLAIRYAPSYYYQDSSTGFHTSRFRPSQSLNLGWGQTYHKWTVGASLSATGGDYNQLLLLSNPEQLLTGAPGTAGELAGAILNGNGANGNLNAVAGGANAIVSGQQQQLYGNSFFSASASTSVGYSLNERTSVSLSVSVSRIQHLPDSSGAQVNYVLQQSTSMGFSAGANHQLSTRSYLNGTITYFRGLSSLYTTPTVNMMVGIGHRLTEHVFVHGAAGAGYILPTSQSSTAASTFQRTQWQASAGLGYRLLRQSFIGNFSRTVADEYGLGGTSTMQVSGGWSFHPTSTPWALTAGGARQQLQGTGLGRNGYRLMAGVNRRLPGRAFMSVSYGYGSGYSAYSYNAGALVNSPFHNQGHSVRLSIGWRPFLGSPDVQNRLPGEIQ